MNERALRVLEFNKILERIKYYAKTDGAKDIISKLKPYDNVFEVNEHLTETEEALDLLIKKGNPPFEGIGDVREAVSLADKGGTLRPIQLLRIGNVLKCARNFKTYLERKEEEEPHRVLEDVAQGIVPLKNLEDEILNAILSEDEISDRASSTLFNIRRALRDKNADVKDKVSSMVRTYSKYLQENLYTVRGDRYVLPVKTEHKGQVQGLVHDVSATGSTLFIEPMSLVNLNNEIKELMLKEKAEIDRILSELSHKINKNINIVSNDVAIVNELDFIFAKAKYGSELRCFKPNVNDNGIIDIIEGRHPLLDQSKVVPSNIYLGKDFTSLVITGPNTGGKTVTLKTLGLIHLMALSGLLIPSKENSTVSFFKEIFADIGDEQSIEQSLSTFSSHMTNIVGIMEQADEKSLVLFDELGAGTDPTEGAALAIAILEKLRNRRVRLMSTTHYSELKGYALKTENVENASVEFDVETLRPTYKLIIGIPGKSNAFEISRRLGLSEDIINAARENIDKESLEFEELIQSLQEKSIKAEAYARDAEVLKIEAEKLKNKYEEKIQSITTTKEKALEEGRREAKKLIKEAKEEADDILKEMRNLERMGYSSSVRKELEEKRRTLKESLEEKESKEKEETKIKSLTKVTEGQEVFIPSLNQKAIVLTQPDNKGEIQVQAGILKINVKLKDITEAKATKEDKKIQKREAKLNLRSVDSSVDIRGMDAEEGIYTVDKYLDEAFMAGLGEVSIIHGKGTGVLRNKINEMLRKHHHVKSYRLGNYGEGGTGVTVVELK